MSEPEDVAEQLSTVLQAIDDGEVEATPVERAYIAGGRDMAEHLGPLVH